MIRFDPNHHPQVHTPKKQPPTAWIISSLWLDCLMSYNVNIVFRIPRDQALLKQTLSHQDVLVSIGPWTWLVLPCSADTKARRTWRSAGPAWRGSRRTPPSESRGRPHWQEHQHRKANPIEKMSKYWVQSGLLESSKNMILDIARGTPQLGPRVRPCQLETRARRRNRRGWG